MFLSQYFGFPLVVSSIECSILIFLYMFIPGQMGKIWEPSKSSHRKGRAVAVRVLHAVFKGQLIGTERC